MTWTAAIMSDDNLDPTSLVGRMLNPVTDETGTGDVIFVAEPEPLPLWRVMAESYAEATESTFRDLDVIREGNAAEIEALRDHMLPPQPEPTSGSSLDQRRAIWRRDNQIREYLTAQARIARGER